MAGLRLEGITLGIGVELELGQHRRGCSGWVSCPHPTHQEGPTCPVCDGEGRFHCVVCGGRHICHRCHGRRRVFDTDLDCPICGGRGTIRCNCPTRPDRPYWFDDMRREHCGWEYRALAASATRPVEWVLSGAPLWADQLSRWAALWEIPDDAGLHVHVSAQYRNPETGRTTRLVQGRVQRIVRAWRMLEPYLYPLADVRLERLGYCGRNTHEYPDNLADFAEMYEDADDDCEMGDRNWARAGRYFALNAWHAWSLHGTVEFRLWNATDCPEYLERALVLSAAVVTAALIVDSEALLEQDRRTVAQALLDLLPKRRGLDPAWEALAPVAGLVPERAEAEAEAMTA